MVSLTLLRTKYHSLREKNRIFSELYANILISDGIKGVKCADVQLKSGVFD